MTAPHADPQSTTTDEDKELQRLYNRVKGREYYEKNRARILERKREYVERKRNERSPLGVIEHNRVWREKQLSQEVPHAD